MGFILRVSEFNFFDNWKEFSIKKPDEQILNHYEMIKNQTDLDGQLKHKSNRELIKVFSILITHNYGSQIFELCNFLKYLNIIKFPIYKTMVTNNFEIIKILKKHNLKIENQISSKFTLNIDNHTFNISYNRIASLIIVLDFIEEFIGIEEVMSIDLIINEAKSYQDLKDISNGISKKIYNYLKNLLPSSYLQKFSAAISDQILKVNNNENHIIVSEDISDDFILNFWMHSNTNQSDISIKTFALAADFCLIYKKSIGLNQYDRPYVIDQINDKEPWNYLSQEQVDVLMNELTYDDKSLLISSIDHVDELQKSKINILKKNQANELKIFSKYDKTTLQLPLTIFRINIFGNIQNKVIETTRRKKGNINFEDYFLNDHFNYQSQILVYKNLIDNLTYLSGIVFYKLWVFSTPETMHFIRDYLDKNEVIIFDQYINDLKNSKFIIENEENISEKIFEKIQQFIKTTNKFQNFMDNIKKLKQLSQVFRRNGFNYNENNKNIVDIETLEKTMNSLSQIKLFLLNFINCFNSSTNDFNSQFNEDRNIFFKQFSSLYNINEVL